MHAACKVRMGAGQLNRSLGVGWQDDSAAPGTPYEVLGVAPMATAQQIRSAYRQQAAKWHPDKWLQGSDEEQKAAVAAFESIQQAHAILGDEQQRTV